MFRHATVANAGAEPARRRRRRDNGPVADVVSGGCLCGGVRFEITGPWIRASHCHCVRCRRHSGGAALTQGRVSREHFRLLQGADLVRAYREDGFATKAFCAVCGSSLFGGSWPAGDEISIRLGAIDGDPGVRPQFHTFTASKAPWDRICDGLPEHPDRYTGPAA